MELLAGSYNCCVMQGSLLTLPKFIPFNYISAVRAFLLTVEMKPFHIMSVETLLFFNSNHKVLTS